MISLIIGNKGSGKTKHLIELVHTAVESSNGNVVCVEKTVNLKHNVDIRARLVASDDFDIRGYDAFYGFLCGLCAGDNDITDVFVDATLKIGGRDYEELATFFEKLSLLGNATDSNFTFTVSADEADLPKRMFDYCKKI
jgi:hypothetical protein